MLPIKGHCSFLLLNFRTIGFCNSSANFLLEIISFLIIPPDVLLSKNL